MSSVDLFCIVFPQEGLVFSREQETPHDTWFCALEGIYWRLHHATKTLFFLLCAKIMAFTGGKKTTVNHCHNKYICRMMASVNTLTSTQAVMPLLYVDLKFIELRAY